MEMLERFIDRCLLGGFLVGSYFCCVSLYGQNDNHNLLNKYSYVVRDIGCVDSIFKVNLGELYAMTRCANNVEIHNHDTMEFVAVVSMMSATDFHTDYYSPFHLSRKDVDMINNWYERNKSRITIDILRRFYIATRVYCFENYDDLKLFFDSLENYIIID